MDYEKKYKEALEKARQLCAYPTTKPFISDLQDLFPELKEESEDENIKSCIGMCLTDADEQRFKDYGTNLKECLDWVKKQCKQKLADKVEPKFKVGDEIKTSNEESLTITKIDENGYWSEDLFICGFDEECIWDLVGQKPIDKAEPKFKVGDTIYYNSFGEVKSMVVSDVVMDGTDNPMYEDKEGNAVFEKDLIEQKLADKPDVLMSLDEAIEHCKEKSCSNNACALEHRQLGEWLIELKELKEQKHVDEVKPKFKIGDWIIYKGDIWKICNINLGAYYKLLKINNEVSIRHFEGVDKTAHLWTIQDARDGDVIFYDSGWTCIFSHIHGIWYSSHCFITADGEFHTGYKEHLVNAKLNGNANPATKEQRDFLFSKMNDAGYRWNLDKKKIEKIEQKSVITIPKFKIGDKIQYSKGCGTIMTIEKIENGEYIFSDNMGHTTIESGNKWYFVEQNLTDNIELSAFKDKLLELFQRFRWYCKDKTPTNGDIIEYVDAHIQELIDTVQNKPWSEEDERMYRGLHNLIYSTPYCDSRKEFSDWLENLKEKLAIMQSQS